ncbi:MAG: class I SAM-dependent methyltransferase, partial [Gemmatimonadetes bacterium]|nr:class I SAM-dependent methyltransferase [Gemmatimonadota bacterium]
MSLASSSDVSRRSRSWLRPLDRALRRGVLTRLGSIEDGGLVIVDGELTRSFGAGNADPHVGRIEVRDPRTWRLCALAGALGFAEAYVRGHWTSPDLVAVLRVFARNIARSSGPGWLDAGPARWLARRWHARRPNSRAGARRNVRDHYDLGNDFFRLFLDETMTYSCAFFARPEISLRDAQLAKLDLVIDALAIGPEDHVLEIGTGWGSFAIRAAARTGCRVTTTTISREQHHEATARVRAAGLADRVEVLDQDYRT